MSQIPRRTSEFQASSAKRPTRYEVTSKISQISI